MTMVIPELELTQVAVQVFFADRMVYAVQATFHDGEETLYRVAVRVAANVLAVAVNRRK